MKKYYKVSVPVDYVLGYLRYGHNEALIESDKDLSREEVIELAKELGKSSWETFVDDYEIEFVGNMDFDNLFYMEVEVDE